jgi:hypothetical protein
MVPDIMLADNDAWLLRPPVLVLRSPVRGHLKDNSGGIWIKTVCNKVCS